LGHIIFVLVRQGYRLGRRASVEAV
jgi:hypothetical protein